MIESQEEQNEIHLHKLRKSNINFWRRKLHLKCRAISFYANMVCVQLTAEKFSHVK